MVSELPIIHIVNTLVQRNIWEVKMETEEIKLLEEDFNRTSTEHLGSL